MIDAPVNGRPAGDILSRVVRVKLAGRDYALPVRSIRFNREWKEQLDERTAGIVAALADAGDDWEKVLGALSQDVEPFIDLLTSYAPGVLTREAIEDMEPDPSMDVINACREVWLAASPLVVIGIEALTTALLQENGGSQLTSSPPPSTDGPPTSSNGGSPTSSSSPTSTLPPTDATDSPPISSKPRSKPSASGRSSPTTKRRSPSGGEAPRGAEHRGRKVSPAPRSRPQ